MTRLLYLPDDEHYALFELALESEALMALIAQGGWRPPGMESSAAGDSLCTFQLGGLVVAFPANRRLQAQHDTAQLVLPDRQALVLRAVAEGMTNRQIARQLHVSVSTVKGHISLLFKRFGVQTRMQLIARAVRMGLID
ncbi:MAG: response regulator transcription factor [Anaerolineae bacterium]|nr:response regulator transcription factor [Anaerolineae bacterium]